MAQRGWEYDVKKCIGCHSCVVACKFENNTYLPGPKDPGGPVNYRIVVQREAGYYPTPSKQFVSMACMHCANPACLVACPETAISKSATDGVVSIDASKCVGCRRCGWACPYGAPQFNEATGKTEKCHFCKDRITAGLEPACVLTCIGRTLKHVASLTPGGTAPTGFAPTDLTNPSIKFT